MSAGGALDLTFASPIRGQVGSECQIRSTGGGATSFRDVSFGFTGRSGQPIARGINIVIDRLGPAPFAGISPTRSDRLEANDKG